MLSANGYYVICSNEHGYYNKFLHRLIIEDFYNVKLPQDWVVHHLDENKTNNELWNLIPMPRTDHISLHHRGFVHSDESKNKISLANKGRKMSNETKRKISQSLKGKNLGRKMSPESRLKMSLNHADVSGENNPMYGVKHSFDKRMDMSKSRNTSGYYCVNKHKSNKVKQGFLWRYQYYDENGKRHAISSTDVEKLEEKVKSKGLVWREV